MSIVEVENVLAEHPGVLDVAVVGMADDVYDEVPVAFVVIDESQLDRADAGSALRGWSEQHLAPSKRPRDYRCVDQLPRTSVGKIRKFLLRAGDPPAAGPRPAGNEIEQPSTKGHNT